MEPIVAIVAAVVAARSSALPLGFVARGVVASQTIKAAQDKAARIVAEARTQQKDMILEAKDEKLRLQREAEEEARANADRAPEPRAPPARPRRAARPARRHARGEEPQDRRPRARARARARGARPSSTRSASSALEQVSGMSAEDAKGVLLEAIREEAEHDAVKLARSIERRARDEAQEKARDIIVTAMQRVAADHTAEHTVTVVHLPSDEMKGRIIGREGRNIRALEQATGVDLIIDDTPETVVLSGFDPVRREVARIALTKLIADGRIHPGPDRGGRHQGPRRGRPRHPPGRRAGRLRRRRPGPAAGPASSCSAGSSTARATARTCSSTASRRASSRRSSPPSSARTSRPPRSAACCTTSARRSTTRSRARTPPSARRSPRSTTCR